MLLRDLTNECFIVFTINFGKILCKMSRYIHRQLPSLIYLFLWLILERSDEHHDNDETIDNTEDDVEAADDSDSLNVMRVDHSGC